MNTDLLAKLVSVLPICLFWVLVYLVFGFIAKILGVKKNLLHNTRKKLKKVEKQTFDFSKAMSSTKVGKKEVLALLQNKIAKTAKNALKIYGVYSFDSPSNPNLSNAYDALKHVYSDIATIDTLIAENAKDEDYLLCLEKIRDDIKVANSMMDFLQDK